MTNIEKRALLVKVCLEDVRYLLSLHCPRFGLDSSEMFDGLKEELQAEFEDNVKEIYG